LKDRFLGQKNIDPDFSATTVAGIWVKQATRRKLKKKGTTRAHVWALVKWARLTWLPRSSSA